MSAELERRQQQQAAGAEQSSNRLNLNSRRNTSSPREPVIHLGWLHFIFVLIFEAELL